MIKKPEQFQDLFSAGREVATKLDSYRGDPKVVVLGIALGGVPVAHEVAKHLKAPLDLIIIRRLLMPQGPGSQACAFNLAGSLIIDENIPPLASVPITPLDHFLADAFEALNRRAQICRDGLPPIDLAGKTLVLVDCGIRSGLTMQAAVGALRRTSSHRIVAAVPVASQTGHAKVSELVDELVCLRQPEPFGNVGLWYSDFSRPDDDQVSELLHDEK